MTERKEPLKEKVPDEYGEKLDLIINILNSHLTKSNKELLFNTLKDLQKEKETSIEFIRYLLLGIQKKSDINEISKKRINKVYKQINYLTRLLKKEGIKIELRPVTYLRWKEDIDLIRVKEQKFLRFFKI